MFLRRECLAWYAGDVKRRIRPILLYLLLGAALNVTVAWSIVFAHGTVWKRHSPVLIMHGDRDIFCFRTKMFGHQVVTASGSLFPYSRNNVPKWFPLESRPAWFPRDVLNDIAEDGYATVIAAGWPCMTFRTWSQDAHGQYKWGFEIRPRDSFAWLIRTDGRAIPTTVPLQPVLAGFAANTGFYAIALWCIVATPAMVRHYLRQRRGLCPRCAYPRENHSVCPECGTAHKGRMAPPFTQPTPPA